MTLNSRAEDTNATVLPSPKVVQPSGKWDGNDGKWSSFMINIGDDGANKRGQNFRVLISTSSTLTQVPLEREGCDKKCAESRGVEIFNNNQPLGFEADQAQGYSEIGLYSIEPPYWLQDHRTNGSYSVANVGLGPASKESWIMPKQIVAGFTTPDDYFMGSFGLESKNTAIGGEPKIPFLVQFNETSTIPSISYGYAAGANYENNERGVFGSLVLGGYDQSRLSGQRVSIPMDASNHTLVVGVQSIQADIDTKSHSFTADATPGGFYAVIDSTLPYLWLPEDVCKDFEDTFQLDYDEEENMYTIDESARNHNKGLDTTVSFILGKDQTNSPDSIVTISLPYAAFDLEASSPIFNDTTRYFPIRKSPNGIFVLGRTFLQGAYLIVDHERNNFTVAPAAFSDPMPPADIVPIFSKDYVTEKPKSSKSGLAAGAIAGIVVGIVAVFAIIGIVGFIWRRRKRRERKKMEEKLSEVDTTQAGDQVKHRRISELSSETGTSRKTSMGGFYDREQKNISPFPPISEMESPPAELYSPPPESITGISAQTPQSDGGSDYFIVGNKVRRRGATRNSSQGVSPGTPAAIAELPGDDGGFTVDGLQFEPVGTTSTSPAHSRGPSDTALPTNISEVIANSQAPSTSQLPTDSSPQPNAPSEEPKMEPQTESTTTQPTAEQSASQLQIERRPSHTRGLSDTTVQSESTAVSEPSPEEIQLWATADNGPRRPLSE